MDKQVCPCHHITRVNKMKIPYNQFIFEKISNNNNVSHTGQGPV